MDILCDQENLDQLMESFASISSIPISVFDRNFHKARSYSRSRCPFCCTMRQDQKFCENCDKSNTDAFRIVERTHEPYLYQCHAGLYELVIPIISEDNLMGFLMIGQFVPEEKQEFVWESILANCTPYGIPLPEKEEFFSQCRILSQKEIMAWAKMAQACTSYICVKKLITSRNDEDFQKVETYIDAHLQSPFSIDELCRETGIPRNRLYETVKKNTGFTVREYIWLIRINKAKTLLTATDVPVSEIAGSVGIEDYNYFTKVFRKITGITPMQFRKNRT